MSKEQDEKSFGTADFVAGAQAPQPAEREMDNGQLAALFPAETAEGFRSNWDAVQIGFVDDPRKAVQQADELVASVMKSLAESFASQRASIEADVGQNDQASTENLRVALRRYRSFFDRLLSL
ncbi:hypothetical protein [Caenimonas soli]|uniref:hypothetical protein n=1 Tax=Caenimonas soli TaxID=2735555 RepID=UPI001557326B|nr:hypothetical protein [Caenimonas soli]NPC58591.1 hypothetical protein [Caenimonas soli]